MSTISCPSGNFSDFNMSWRGCTHIAKSRQVPRHKLNTLDTRLISDLDDTWMLGNKGSKDMQVDVIDKYGQ